MHCKKPLSAAIACVMIMLVGCDRTVETGNYRLHVSPSLGLIKNASFRVYGADGMKTIAKGNTGPSGGVIGSHPFYGNGPAVIAIMGDDEDATYYDEYLQADVSFPAGYTLHGLFPSSMGDYAVSPLTELAYRIAVDQQLFPLTANEVNTLNERVRATFAPELDSIIHPLTIMDATVLPNTLTNTHANRYALRLAAMAALGSADSRPALAVMAALGNDVLDGVIDGLDKNGNPLSTPYDPNTLVADMDNNINTAATQYAAPDLISAIVAYSPMSLTINVTNIDDGSNFTGCNEGVSTLPVEIAGQALDMIYEKVEATSPYAQDQVVRFAFCSNGQLRLSTIPYGVSNVFATNVIDAFTTSFTWTLASNGMSYELVALSNTIYEVNIYGGNGSVYYGRFKPY